MLGPTGFLERMNTPNEPAPCALNRGSVNYQFEYHAFYEILAPHRRENCDKAEFGVNTRIDPYPNDTEEICKAYQERRGENKCNGFKMKHVISRIIDLAETATHICSHVTVSITKLWLLVSFMCQHGESERRHYKEKESVSM